MIENTKNLEKKNRAAEFFRSTYRYENLALFIIALFALELGVLLLVGTLEIPSTVFFLGEYWLIIAIVLVLLGVGSSALALSSFYISSFQEVKHIKGLKRSEFLSNILQVIIFVVILALFFTLCDWGLEALLTLF